MSGPPCGPCRRQSRLHKNSINNTILKKPSVVAWGNLLGDNFPLSNFHPLLHLLPLAVFAFVCNMKTKFRCGSATMSSIEWCCSTRTTSLLVRLKWLSQYGVSEQTLTTSTVRIKVTKPADYCMSGSQISPIGFFQDLSSHLHLLTPHHAGARRLAHANAS